MDETKMKVKTPRQCQASTASFNIGEKKIKNKT